MPRRGWARCGLWASTWIIRRWRSGQGAYGCWPPILQRDRLHRESGERESRRALAHLGYEDLIGQLRTALDQFPGVTMVNFTTVSVLMGFICC